MSCICVYIYVETAMNLKESRVGYMSGFGGKKEKGKCYYSFKNKNKSKQARVCFPVSRTAGSEDIFVIYVL